MFLTLHATFAVVVSESITSKVVGFLLGVLSHFVLDLIPHGDKGLDRWLNKDHRLFLKISIVGLLDLTVLTLLALFALPHLPVSHPYVAFWTACGALVPDLVWSLNMLTGDKIKIIRFISHLHHRLGNLVKDNLPFLPGLALQVAVFAVLILFQVKILN